MRFRSDISIRTKALIALSLAVAACGGGSPPFREIADTKQLMTSVIEPAAEVYWDSVGIIMDIKEGMREIKPRTEEEWTAVRDAALVVAESGNLLLLPGRIRGDGPWVKLVTEFTETARAALAAAQSKDAAAVFDTGGELYLACSRCHEAFAPHSLRPNFDRGIIKD